jgi:hypothetical protein
VTTRMPPCWIDYLDWFQIGRIRNVARRHEAARFLGTTARVRPIHKPAAVVHEAVQVAARTGKLLAEVLATDLQQLGSDGIGHFENLAQDVDQALFSIEAEQHAGCAR